MLGQQKNVVIVGGSLAGKAIASMLMRSDIKKCLKSVTIVEKWSSSNNDKLLSTGIWSPAISIMHKNLGIHLDELMKVAFPIGVSGYRDSLGLWLARPSVRNTKDGVPILSFIRSHDLLELMENSVQAAKKDLGSCIYSTLLGQVSGFGEGTDGLMIHLQDGTRLHADLVIAADGSHSTLAEWLHSAPSSFSSLEHRGYKVFRGIAAKAHLPATADPSVAFQTWSAGKRFASVPLRSAARAEADACAWFAAISCAPERPHRSVHDGPLMNQSAPISQQEYEDLLRRFAGHHEPIVDLLHATPKEHIVHCHALASASCSAEGRSRVLLVGKEGSRQKQVPVVFIGDANHTLDPILAQGAGRAIEDAYHFVRAYEKFFFAKPHRALEEYHRISYMRTSKLHRLSDLAQAIGHMESERHCAMRDRLLRLLPDVLKTAVFDAAIRYAAS